MVVRIMYIEHISMLGGVQSFILSVGTRSRGMAKTMTRK